MIKNSEARENLEGAEVKFADLKNEAFDRAMEMKHPQEIKNFLGEDFADFMEFYQIMKDMNAKGFALGVSFNEEEPDEGPSPVLCNIKTGNMLELNTLIALGGKLNELLLGSNLDWVNAD